LLKLASTRFHTAGGGSNDIEAARMAVGPASRSEREVEVFHVEPAAVGLRRVRGFFRRRPNTSAMDGFFAGVRGLSKGARPPRIRSVVASDIGKAVLGEARNGYDIVLLGAPAAGLSGTVLESVVAASPCHVAIVKAAGESLDYQRLLVPADGSIASRLAVEFAVRYAEATGAAVTLAIAGPAPEETEARRADLVRLSEVFRASQVRPELRQVKPNGKGPESIAGEAERGHYDLVVVGAENRGIQRQLFLGGEIVQLLGSSPVSVVVLVPNIGKLH
jgi:nucleotide-binding universal stress UspA family protein